MRRTTTGLVAVLALALAGATVAVAAVRAGGARHERGLRALGLKAYFGILTEEQKVQAKEIVADHLAATQADRLAALARLLEYRAEVAAVLTPEQRRKAMRIRATMKNLAAEKRRNLVDGLLDGTDRAGLAARVASLEGASPAERVDIGLAILDQLKDLLIEESRERLDLTDGQVEAIEGHYARFRRDIVPVAIRLADARAATVEKGMALLTPEQREKLKTFGAEVRGKILDFLNG